MKYPKFLEKTSVIGVLAPSAGNSSIERQNKIKAAQKYWEQKGNKVVLSENIFNNYKGRSASAKERGEEINAMFKDENIDFIICAGGGDFLIECLPYVDYKLIKEKSKYIAGFSDPTGLLYSITTKCDVATIYGQNFAAFGADTLYDAHHDFENIIEGKQNTVNSYELYEEEEKETVTGLEGYNLTEKVYWETLDEKPCQIKGRVIGGCFDIISEIAGTSFDGIKDFNEKYKDDGIIWYFDNCEKSMEDTIRILWKLNELEFFKYTKGIVFGRFGKNSTYYDYDVKSCLEDSAVGKMNIPIIYNADISHKSPCIPIINGTIMTLEVKDGKASITYELK